MAFNDDDGVTEDQPKCLMEAAVAVMPHVIAKQNKNKEKKNANNRASVVLLERFDSIDQLRSKGKILR